MLQLFGSISPLLDTDENSVFGDANKVLNDSLFSSSDYANDWLERERCQNEKIHLGSVYTSIFHFSISCTGSRAELIPVAALARAHRDRSTPSA